MQPKIATPVEPQPEPPVIEIENGDTSISLEDWIRNAEDATTLHTAP